MTQSNSWTVVSGRRGFLPVIRFQPDGFVSDSSPLRIDFVQGQKTIAILLNASHTRYEINLNPPIRGRF
jgi:hypothetical protein